MSAHEIVIAPVTTNLGDLECCGHCSCGWESITHPDRELIEGECAQHVSDETTSPTGHEQRSYVSSPTPDGMCVRATCSCGWRSDSLRGTVGAREAWKRHHARMVDWEAQDSIPPPEPSPELKIEVGDYIANAVIAAARRTGAPVPMGSTHDAFFFALGVLVERAQ